MREVTDPTLLAALNGTAPAGPGEVTDPALLAALNDDRPQTGFPLSPDEMFYDPATEFDSNPAAQQEAQSLINLRNYADQMAQQPPLQAPVPYGPGSGFEEQALPQPAPAIGEDLPWYEDVGLGLERGLMAPAEGVEQFWLDLPFGDPKEARAFRDKVRQRRENFAGTRAGQSTGGAVGEFVGEALPYALAPGGAAGGLLRRAVTGGLSGAAQGATQWTDDPSDRAGNILVGAGMGGGASTFMGSVEKLATRFANLRRGLYDNPETADLLNLGREHGVDTLASDFGSKSLNNLENAAGGMTQGARELQQQQVQGAADALVDKYRVEMMGTQYGALPALAEEVFTGGSHAKAATALVQQMDGLGDDWQRIAQTAGNSEALTRKIAATKLYDTVEQMAATKGAVAPTQTLRAIDDAIRDAQQDILPDPTLVNQLQTIRESFMQPRDFAQMRDARSNLGDLISDFYKGQNQITGSKGASGLQSVRNALEDDMAGFANSNGPELHAAWKEADGFYKSEVIPYKDRALANALKAADADEVVARFMATGLKKDRVERFYNALNGKGQAAVRFGMLSDAYTRALNPDTGLFSPQKFTNALKKNQGAYDVLFQGEDAAYLNGFRKLMSAVNKAGWTDANPQTGIQMLPMLRQGAGVAAGSAIGGAVAGTPGAVSGAFIGRSVGDKIIEQLLTNQSMKRLILAADELPLDDFRWKDLINMTERMIRAGSVEAVTQ